MVKLKKKIVKDLISTCDDIICVFLDMMPGNRNIRTIYKRLRELSIVNNYRIVVIGIPCAEYYVIKMLYQHKELVKDSHSIEECINFVYYANASVVTTQEDRAFCKNFEKLCKLILRKCFVECAIDSAALSENSGKYYLNDCKCRLCTINCSDRTLYTKSFELLCEYPCVPSNSNVRDGNKRELSLDEIWDIHRESIENYNRLVDKYKAETDESIDSENNKYSKVKAIK